MLWPSPQHATPALFRQVCEFGGAVLMGSGVTSTIRRGIADLDQFDGAPELLMYGMMCALAATSAWLLIATRLELPVSTTHTVGATPCFKFLKAQCEMDFSTQQCLDYL